MKKLFAAVMLAVALLWGTTHAQSFSTTNTYIMTNVVQAITTFDMNLVPVVSSAGTPLTNSSRWGTWIPRYIDAVIYTNGLTTNNVTGVKVLWTSPDKKLTYQERSIYQGMPDTWDGKSYVSLPLAKERILTGQRIHCLIGFQDNSTSLTNLTSQTNVVWAVNGVAYKVIPIPANKPAWLP